VKWGSTDITYPAQSLIVKKSIQNSEITTTGDLVASIEIFNVGRSPVYDVQLEDNSWASQFDVKVGLLSAKWEKIPADSNITHTFVLAAKEGQVELHSLLTTSPAVVRYRESPKADQQTVLSTTVGRLHVLGKNADRRSQPHFKEWGVFGFLALTAILLPFGAWGYLQTNYRNGVERKKRR